jgi:hypothetical protein
LSKIVDLTGYQFGMLVVINRGTTNITPNGTHRTMWECLCKCGSKCTISLSNIKSGNTKSCGCIRLASTIQRSTTHGKTKTGTYRSYHAMLNRCYNPNYKNFQYWGGDGVIVCDRWICSFENFLEDMGIRPQDTTLNRVEGSKVYCKENCRWDSKGVQAYDQRMYKNNKTGVTGVYRTKSGKYVARINVKNEDIHLGSFHTLDEARLIRQDAEILYYGKIKVVYK